MQPAFQVGVDVGGTFTDLVAVEKRTGARTVLKCPSTPEAPEQAVLTAVDLLHERYPDATISSIAHSTTVATNALLGQLNLELPRLVFLTTQGFRDVIEIGRQNRKEIYNLFVTRPKPLVSRQDRIGVCERIDARGKVLIALTGAEIERAIGEVRARKAQAVAIGFLNSYVNDAHERELAAALAAALPELSITCSAEIDPEYREYERFSTAVVNAALQPIVQSYLQRLEAALLERRIEAPLFVMQSNGGMAAASRVASRPATIIESGPAAGVIAAAEIAMASGIDRALSFDMGGTTAKCGTIRAGEVRIAYEFEAGGESHSGRQVKGSGYPVRFPFVDLAEISAGGGTIAWIDDAGALRVGPISAGADPGPACYGKSDRATVTDANVVLGRCNPSALAGGTFPIDAKLAHDAIAALAERLSMDIFETAAGIVRIVDAQMAKALRIVTVERGLDPRSFSIIAFGGNGPLHACALAEELGVSRILVPESPGVFSALGLLVGDLRASYVRPLLVGTEKADAIELEALFDRLEREGRDTLRSQGAETSAIRVQKTYDARYSGQSFELDVPHAPDLGAVAQHFHEEHRKRYGYATLDEPVELVNARLTTIGALARLPSQRVSNGVPAPSGNRFRGVWIDARSRNAPIFDRETLQPAWSTHGPAVVEQYDATTYVAPGWSVSLDNMNVLTMVRDG